MTSGNEIKIRDLIAPAFYKVHSDIKKNKHTHYFLKGGRGSAKSSFVSIEIIYGMMCNPDMHCVALRKVAAYLKDSVYSQLKWAIEMLGVEEEWEEKLSPLELVYKKTGQRIIFRGADDPKKIKSLKVSNGYIGYVWYEEADQFSGMAEIRNINQSLLRGGKNYKAFYSYNPPMSIKSWINLEVNEPVKDRYIHSSSYLDVPKEWIGEPFITEAEHIKKTRERIYRHEYLGEAVGTGGEIFDNLTVREITKQERQAFDQIRCGVDFGYAADPFVFIACSLQKRKLYIFDEIFEVGLSNERAAKMIRDRQYDVPVICDSAEPKSIQQLRELGIRAIGARKGPDSINYGIKFLQGLDEIIIDPVCCPNAVREFSGYELERDLYGGFRADFPDKDNHTIDAIRYATESCNRKAKIIERKMFI